MLKKILATGMIGAVVATNAIAGDNITDKTISAEIKHVNINNVAKGNAIGLKYSINIGLGEPGEWGLIYVLSYDYASSFTNKYTTGTSKYSDFGIKFGPSYTFKSMVRVYAGIQADYVDLINNDDDYDNQGNMILGMAGAEYPITKNIVIDIEGASGNTSFNGVKYKTTTFSTNVGWVF